MIRLKIKERIAKKEFDEDRRITMNEVAEATGIHRMTLSKIVNQKGYNTGTDIIDRLCFFFDCKVEDLLEHVDESNEGLNH